MKIKLLIISIFIMSFNHIINPTVNAMVNQNLRISDVSPLNLNNINKIIFYDGRGLNKPLVLKDKKRINEFVKCLNYYIIKKANSSDIKIGWVHEAVLYNGNKKQFYIIFGNPININENYYNVIKNNLSTEKIDKFLKSINPEWKVFKLENKKKR